MKKKNKVDEFKRLEKPFDVKESEIAFGSNTDIFLPDYHWLLENFGNNPERNKFEKIITNWFFYGLPENVQFIPKENIDAKTAYHHISSCLRSWKPKHEHKILGCAFLLWLWFSDIIIDESEMQELIKKFIEIIKK